MASQENQQGQEFKFTMIELDKTNTLGAGAYGSVCLARCDDLPCAAKILHDILFRFDDPGVVTMLHRFEQECQFLSAIKHPNIVQYLGTHHDPDTGLPVLLMELMDESLTHHLKRALRPLPFHTQVNFCHDVSLALAFLHSNGIIHRDLSSNNVLLIAGRRAKVTDFGMSKLAMVNPRLTPQTMCPGTMAYMSPEALKELPVYTEKLDCFSLGSLIIQIVTRQFPDPTERFTTLIVNDPRRPKEVIEVQAPVPERERRENHISLIEPNYPLLPIALDCIKDRDIERPSAHELCGRLEALKQLPEYVQSREESGTEQLQQALCEKETIINGKDEEISRLEQEKEEDRQRIDDQQRFLQDKDLIIQDKDRIIRAKEQELQQYLLTSKKDSDGIPAGDIRISWRESKDAPKALSYGSAAVIRNKAYFADYKDAFEFDIQNESWSILPPCRSRGFSLVNVRNNLTTVGGTDKRRSLFRWDSMYKEWKETLSPMNKIHFGRPMVLCNDKYLLVVGGMLFDDKTVEVLDIDTLQWSEVGQYRTSVSIRSGSAHLIDDTIYFIGTYDFWGANVTVEVLCCSLTKIIFQKDSKINWSTITNTPFYRSQGAQVQGQLLAIGGSSHYRIKEEGMNLLDIKDEAILSAKISPDVFKYDQTSKKWEKVSELRIARADCLVVVLPENKIMVVGGNTANGHKTSSVEIGTVL